MKQSVATYKLHQFEKQIAAQFRQGNQTLSDEQQKQREQLKAAVLKEQVKNIFITK